MPTLIHWLQDMYALGQHNIQTLQQYHAVFMAYPDMREALQQHTIETRQQVDDIHECLASMHAKVLAPKATGTSVHGIIEPTSVTPFADTPIHNLMLLYTSEQFSYACYAALAESARHHGAYETADICERIAEQELAMAEWVEEQIPHMVGATIRQKDMP